MSQVLYFITRLSDVLKYIDWKMATDLNVYVFVRAMTVVTCTYAHTRIIPHDCVIREYQQDVRKI